ncbi:MAG: TonB-dependent receptor, partial [Prevotellaceae bacterium]|nr:TonB-dependent receptor [Prevotellaceae bacterium]
AQAQTSITGKVSDAKSGEAIPFASVVVKGTTIGVNTDIDGNYSISVPATATTLVFSEVGHTDLEVDISGRTVINVAMEPGATQLDEVIVVAYGTASRATITGAAATIKPEKIVKDAPIASIEQVLQGASPGIAVGMNSGQPGAAVGVRIRGIGSFNASNTPLYVVDGIPITTGDISVTGVSNDSKSLSALVGLNPNDIENISILKDAAAASLYGSKGANGVILITTKKGKVGKIAFNFRGSWGVSDWAVENRPIVSGDQQNELLVEALRNYAMDAGDSYEEAQAWADANAANYSPKQAKYSDWKDELFRKGNVQTYEISAQGGDSQNRFFASFLYRKDQGMVENSKMKTYTARFNYNYTKDKIKFGANINLSNVDQRVTSEGSAYANPWFGVNYWLKPNVPIYNEDGTFYEGALLRNLPNLAKDLDLDYNGNTVFQSNNSAWASYDIIEGLTLKQTISYNFILNNGRTTWPTNSNNGATHKGLTIMIPEQREQLYSSTVLNYSTTIKEKHQIAVLAGWDVDKKSSRYTYAVGRNIPLGLWELENAAEPMTAASGHDDDRLLSFLSNAEYIYDGKYIIGGTFRTDGSTRLGSNNRWGKFWSVSGAWRISEESFMSNVSFVKDLKIRGSYGVSGTLPSSLYAHMDLYTYGTDYNGIPGMRPSRVPNPDLAWEKNYTLDLGLDVRLFDRVSIIFDYYNRTTKDLLFDTPISSVTGFSSTLRNVAEMSNKGIELDINVDIIRNRDFNWTAGLALSHNKNRIEKLYNGEPSPDGIYRLEEGYSRYSVHTREWAGVDPANGDMLWVKNSEILDDQGRVTGIDKSITNDPSLSVRTHHNIDPKIVGGIRNYFTWKGVELNFLFSFSLGGQLYDGQNVYTRNDGYNVSTMNAASQLDRWQKPGDVASNPKRVYNHKYYNYGSDRWMYKNNYLRLKTISLAYNLPEKLLKPVGLSSFRINVSGTNLLTWKNDHPFDPEIPVTYSVGWSFPQTKTIVFGIEIGF